VRGQEENRGREEKEQRERRGDREIRERMRECGENRKSTGRQEDSRKKTSRDRKR
jgi:hypothetical protein